MISEAFSTVMNQVQTLRNKSVETAQLVAETLAQLSQDNNLSVKIEYEADNYSYQSMEYWVVSPSNETLQSGVIAIYASGEVRFDGQQKEDVTFNVAGMLPAEAAAVIVSRFADEDHFGVREILDAKLSMLLLPTQSPNGANAPKPSC